jgi:hypothetical protein
VPRPLLEIWSEQNRERDRDPSWLLKVAETVPSREALRRMQQSPTIGRLRTFAQTAPVREMHEAMRLVAERPIGRKRPFSPTQPDKPKPKPKPKHELKHGVGRNRSFTDEQIEQGIGILRGKPKMPLDAACKTLEEAGIRGSRSAVYRWIFNLAYASE